MAHPRGPHPVHSHGPQLARLLELDAEIHSGVLAEAVSLVSRLSGDAVRRVLDVGAGTGTGSIALARRFPSAEVVAVDVDEHMLERVRDRAAASGLGDRIVPVHVDIAAAAPAIGLADVVWSSSALHEVGDPDRAFRNLFEALRPGGVLAVLEMDAPPLVLPKRYVDLEERVRSAGAVNSADHPDWASAIEAAGFEVPRTRRMATDLVLAADGPAGEYAALELRRVGHAAMPALRESDRATLMALAGEGAGGVRTL
ncbi:MAG TPA: methyltransferase domain-containing protein, partial [Umezawaea sp.]|nr:methyltransferase domain-containing protein [Umezawaea sp.]